MDKQIYYEEVEVGSQITPLQKIATARMLVQWAGAADDFNPLHFEEDYAKNMGVDRPIVHGALKRGWLINLMTNWVGENGTLKKFSCRYRAIDYPRKMKTWSMPKDGETWWCKGKVTKKYIKDGECCVECEIWVENGKGEKTTTGNATAVLSSKPNK